MIVRSTRIDNYTKVGNEIFADDRISFRAKGVLMYLLSKPDSWKVSERQLAAVGDEGVTAIRAALKELERAGYIQRCRRQGANGRFEWESVVFDEPQAVQLEPEEGAPCSENLSMGEPPCLGFPCVEKPCTENHPMETCAVVITIGTITDQVRTTDDDCARDLPAPPPPAVSSSSPAPVERIKLPAAAVAALIQPQDPAYLAAKVAWDRHMRGTITPTLSDQIKIALTTYPPEWIPLAMETAASKNKGFWGYVEGILRTWQQEGINLSARAGNTAKSGSKSMGYGRFMQQPAASKKETQNEYENDPEYIAFLASFNDGAAGDTAIAADRVRMQDGTLATYPRTDGYAADGRRTH